MEETHVVDLIGRLVLLIQQVDWLSTDKSILYFPEKTRNLVYF